MQVAAGGLLSLQQQSRTFARVGMVKFQRHCCASTARVSGRQQDAIKSLLDKDVLYRAKFRKAPSPELGHWLLGPGGVELELQQHCGHKV